MIITFETRALHHKLLQEKKQKQDMFQTQSKRDVDMKGNEIFRQTICNLG